MKYLKIIIIGVNSNKHRMKETGRNEKTKQ